MNVLSFVITLYLSKGDMSWGFSIQRVFVQNVNVLGVIWQGGKYPGDTCAGGINVLGITGLGILPRRFCPRCVITFITFIHKHIVCHPLAD